MYVFIVQVYQTSMELLSTWCCVAASGVQLSQEVDDSKIMSNQPALWTSNGINKLQN
jgi:hypothetical protein